LIDQRGKAKPDTTVRLAIGGPTGPRCSADSLHRERHMRRGLLYTPVPRDADHGVANDGSRRRPKLPSDDNLR
jgi:hypothetical protein